MKILLINTVSLGANGISTFIINSAIGLAKNNINVTIAAINRVNRPLKDKLLANKINLKEFQGRNSSPIKYFYALKNYLIRNRFDVVHVNGNSTTMAIELLAAKSAGVKLRIAHSHNTTTEHPFINKLLRPIFEYSVNGRLACNDAAGRWLFKRKKFDVIKNGINLEKYDYSLEKRQFFRKKLNLESNQKLLGHVGTFSYQKNQAFLVELLKNISVEYKLILIGDGPELENVKLKAKKLDLDNRVIFTGNVDNVNDYLSAMDLFLLPSRFEGQPFVLIESSAMGLNNLISDKVSKETNICNNNIYLNLDNLSEWKKAIVNNKFNNREKLFYKNQKILKAKDYDVVSNVNKLLNYYNTRS